MPIFRKFQRLDKEKSIKTRLSPWVIYIYVQCSVGVPTHSLNTLDASRGHLVVTMASIRFIFFSFYCGCAAAFAAAPRLCSHNGALKRILSQYCILTFSQVKHYNKVLLNFY